MNELKDYADQNIIYAGFVDDISIYFKGVDVFINPVTDGGGIKTKLVEALGYNLNVVSTMNGAIGVDEKICNGKLFVCENDDWQTFADFMESALYFQNNITRIFPAFLLGKHCEKSCRIDNAMSYGRIDRINFCFNSLLSNKADLSME